MRRLIAILLAVMLVAVASWRPAKASTGTITIDFDGNNSGYSLGLGTIGAGRTGNGVNGKKFINPSSPWPYDSSSYVVVPIDSSLCGGGEITITHVAFDGYTASPQISRALRITLSHADGSTELKQGGTPPNAAWYTAGATGTWTTITSVAFEAAASSTAAGDYPSVSTNLDNISISYSCHIVAAFDATPLTGNAPLQVNFTDQSVGATSWHWDLGDGNSTTQQNITYVYNTPGAYTVTLTVTDGSQTDTESKVIYVNAAASVGAAASYKPLTTTDQNVDWGMYDVDYARSLNPLNGVDAGQLYPKPNVVFAWSTNYGANVHAVGDGEVTAITPTRSTANCDPSLNPGGDDVHGGHILGFNGGIIGGQCIIVVPAGIAAHGGGLPGTYYVFRLDLNNLQQVTVTHADGQTITYLVTDPQVTVGAHVTAGCIIGKTMQVYNLVGLDIQSIFAVLGAIDDGGAYVMPKNDSLNVGLTILIPHLTDSEHLDDDGNPIEQRLLPLLLLEPDNLTPCNVDPAHASCQKGANMYDPADWNQSGSVIWNLGTSPTLYPGAILTQQLPLQQDQAYSFTVNARRLGSTGHIQLQLGNAIQDFELTTQVATVSLPAQIRPPDGGLVYTVSIVNTGQEPLQIIDGCVSQGTPTQNLSTCKFLNPSFDDGLSSWSHSNDIQVGNYIGEVFVHDASTLSQNLQLYPNGASAYEYQVTLRAAPGGVGWQDQSASEVSFSWTYGALSGDFLSPNSSPNYPLSSFNATPNYINFYPGGEVIFQATVHIDAPVSAPFIVTVHYDQEDGWQGPVLIREICITDAFGNDAGSGGGGLPWQPTCSIVSPPQDNNVSSWTYFLWSSLDRFFRCDLMTAINKGLDGLNQLISFLRWQMLYWQSFVFMVANWISTQLLPWLGGHFRNMATGAGVTVIQSGTSTSIWDVLLAVVNGVLTPFTNTILSLINQASTLFFGLIVQLITFAVSLFGTIIGYLSTAAGILSSLAAAWNNSTPTPIPYLPTCANPRSSAFCILTWALDNTFLSGTGAFFVPVVIGISAAHLLIYGAGKIRALALTLRHA